jgi:hypothetical protein
VSALGHFLEDEGVPTTAISLVRVQTEKVGGPRALWVPFELGRPLGPPRDAAFQTDVISAALGLLTAMPGPVLLEDYPRDDPTAADNAAWRASFDGDAAAVDWSDHAGLQAALTRELHGVLPAYRRFVAANGRTTFGVSGLDIEACIACLASGLAAEVPDNPPPAVSPVQALRWAVDDIKAFYLEAASAGPGIPSSRQVQAWFWDRTLAARAIIALRAKLMASADKRIQAVGRMSLVPGVQALRLGLA